MFDACFERVVNRLGSGLPGPGEFGMGLKLGKYLESLLEPRKCLCNQFAQFAHLPTSQDSDSKL